jgi:hypothetical protein
MTIVEVALVEPAWAEVSVSPVAPPLGWACAIAGLAATSVARLAPTRCIFILIGLPDFGFVAPRSPLEVRNASPLGHGFPK